MKTAIFVAAGLCLTLLMIIVADLVFDGSSQPAAPVSRSAPEQAPLPTFKVQ